MEQANIPLDQIKPAPWNPPERIDLDNVQGLADSIKQHGQIHPATVRPVNGHYELVNGHRRYAAKLLLAQDDPDENYLWCMVADFSMPQAMILAGVENLQREDFSEFEEAEFLVKVSQSGGQEAVKSVAEKLSLSLPYVRKRLAVFALPEEVLEMWRDEQITISHLLQLLRLGDRVEEFLGEFCYDLEDMTVAELREQVDREAIDLHAGPFSKDDCKFCSKNSDFQGNLFELPKDSKCLDRKCFLNKLTAWLDAHWKETNEFGTNQAIIGSWNTEKTGEFGWEAKPGEKCQECPHFTTILRENFTPYTRQVCMGEKPCYLSMKNKDRMTDAEKREVDPTTRVAWHGEFFRQEFYQAEVPNLIHSLPQEDPRRLQVTLASLVSGGTSAEWFREIFGLGDVWYIRFKDVLEVVRDLDKATVEQLLAEAALRTAFESKEHRYIFDDEDRQALAQFFEIDFSNFEVTEEYLKKKTKAELVQFIVKDSGLLIDQDFLRYIKARGWLGPDATAEKLAALKKGQLVDLILADGGWSLKGRLPREIRLNTEG